ncbi:MAG: Maf-like protein [Hyphomicrobiales bacterium]|nr:Maf-like protein [Hyphomicrobiales bacterium]
MTEDDGAEIILASRSPSRQALLSNAGISFTVHVADIDERAVEAPLLEAGFPADDIALLLAEAKAEKVSADHPDAFVIGADQVLAFEDDLLVKPETMEDARRQLLRLRGRTHSLHAAVVVAQGGETKWHEISTAHMTMRDFGPDFVGRYLARAGEDVLTSVGAYRLEGLGVQLFEKIDGDYFTILGLPLLPLLDYLRAEGAIET